MKRKLLSLLTVIALLLCVSYPLFAEIPNDDRMPKREMPERMMPEHQMMMQHMPSMKKDIKLVATSDGGVVILSGNKLLKFDANLKLIAENEIKPAEKEVKIKLDKKDMHREGPTLEEGRGGI